MIYIFVLVPIALKIVNPLVASAVYLRIGRISQATIGPALTSCRSKHVGSVMLVIGCISD